MIEKRKVGALCAFTLAAALLAMARVAPPSVARLAMERVVARPPRSSVADATAGEGARALRDGAPLDLNRATATELALLPGIGPTLAARIVAHRGDNGPFSSIDALSEVRGVGPRTVARIEGLAKVSP